MAAFAAVFAACSQQEAVNVTISNPLNTERSGEMVEVSAKTIFDRLKLSDDASFVVYDENAKEVPYQLTYDNKVVFPTKVGAGATVNYTIQEGNPAKVEAVVFGRQYPERMEDMAWENDCSGYRAYGPVLQKLGEKAFGYDIFTKSTRKLVLEDRYAKELDPVLRPKIRQLRKEGKMEEAKFLEKDISYHIDHGDGMDAYAVGPTLGAGVAALYPEGQIVYPYTYNEYEILDNGPLRFTVKLVFKPLKVKDNENVIETRIIQLDKGSHLNKTTVSYSSLAEKTPLVAGIVLHDPYADRYSYSAEEGYLAYADPTTNVNANNGIIYVGVVFPGVVKEAKVEMFDKPMGAALGHVLGVSEYVPENDFVYYWGSGWSKDRFATDADWTNYIKTYAGNVRNPLKITIQ